MNAMLCFLCIHNHPRKNTSILAFLEVGLSNILEAPVNGLPPIPSGLPLTPDANLRPELRPEELRGRCCTGVEKEEVVVPVKARWAGDGVPRDTERGDSDVPGVRRGEGRVPEGDALYRGGVIVSFADFAMGVISGCQQRC